MQQSLIRVLTSVAAATLAAMGVVAAPSIAAADADHGQSTGLTTTVFASGGIIAGGKVISKPDDITSMDGSIVVSWQNGVGPNGDPAGSVTESTVVQYASSGRILNSWQLTGRCDGLTADPQHPGAHRHRQRGQQFDPVCHPA